MFCQSCAKELEPNDIVCSACGAPVARVNVASGTISNEAKSTSQGNLRTAGGTKRFSPAVFGFALLCFLLPFVTVSCNQQKVASFSGFQLVFGTTVQQPQMFGPPKVQRIDGEPLAVLAFVCCTVALGLSLAKSRGGEIGATVLSGISFIALLLLKSKLEGEVRQQAGGLLQVDYGAGFYLVMILLAVAIGTRFYTFSTGSSAHLLAFDGGAGSKFCRQCGARNAAADLFCRACGKRFG